MPSPDGNNGGNRATLPGVDDHLTSWGLPQGIALGGGLPAGWPPAQGIRGDVSPGARDQDPAHRRGSRSARRADAAQLRAGMGRLLRRPRRQRRHQRPHASRVSAAADHLRPRVLRARCAPARYRRTLRPRIRRLAVPPDRRGRSATLRPVGAQRRAAASIVPAARRPGWPGRLRLGAHHLAAAASPRPRLRVRRAPFPDASAACAAAGRDPQSVAAVVRAARLDWPADLRGDRAADHGRRPQRSAAADPCAPRDRQRPAHGSEVAARQAHDPDQP